MIAAGDLYRRRMRLVVVSTAGVFVILLVLQLTDLWTRRSQALEAAERRATNLAVIVTAYLQEAFAAHDAALRQIAIQSPRMGGPAARGDLWMPLLTSAMAGLTGAGSLSIVDAAGTIRHSSIYALIGQSRRDDYLFRQLATSVAGQLVVGTPYRALSDPRRFVIPLGRRLATPAGGFDGAIVATLIPEETRRFLSTIDVGREGRLWVFHPDGVIVFHEPAEAGDTGKPATSMPLFEQVRRSQGNGIHRSPVTPGGPLFISAAHRLTAHPLIVAVSLSQNEVLSDWRSDIVATVAAFTALGLLATVVLFAMHRQTAGRAEAERGRRIAEERMRFALDAARVGTWEIDLTTDAMHWSESLEAIHGMAPGSFAGTFEAWIDRVHPDERQDIRAAFTEATRLQSDSSVLYRTRWPDGSLHWIRSRGRTLDDASGTPRRAAGVGFDVTELRTLEERYRQSQKMEAVGQLAGGVAHDFNNFLTAITGYSTLLLDQVAEQPIRHDLEQIHRAAESAASLTQQLLAFSRRQILQPHVLNLNDVVHRMHALLKRLIGEDIDLDTRLSSSLDHVRADPGQIEQIVMNLALNARDAMPAGGRLTIETANVTLEESYARQHAGAAPGPHAMLAISDTGTGMDADTRAHLFEPFFTTKGQGKGTGLGLATVYGIVKQSGGSIWVYSEPDRGTTFKVYLPAVAAPASARPVAPTPRALDGTETILVAEDQAEVRSVVRAALARRGYTVLEAADGEDALRTVREYNGPIHLLLTDVVMPSISGRELVKLVRSYRTIKVLYMSGYTNDAIVRHGVLEAGIAFIQKPFTPIALLTKVREILDAGNAEGPAVS